MLNVLPNVQDKNSSSFSNQPPLSLILRASATPYCERFNKKKTSEKIKRRENTLNYVYKSTEYLNNNTKNNNKNNNNNRYNKNNNVLKKNYQNSSAKNKLCYWSNTSGNNKNNNKYNNTNKNDIILPLMVRSKSAFTTQQEFFNNNYNKNYSNINIFNKNYSNTNILNKNYNSNYDTRNNNNDTRNKHNIKNIKFPSFNEDKRNNDEHHTSSDSALKNLFSRNITFLSSNRAGLNNKNNNHETDNNTTNNNNFNNKNNSFNNNYSNENSTENNDNQNKSSNTINNNADSHTGNTEHVSEDEQRIKNKIDKKYSIEKKKLSGKSSKGMGENGSMAELDKGTLKFNGVLSLDTLDKSWPIASLTSVSKMIFKDICITDLPKSLNKIKNRFPNAVNFHFINNNITLLHHLHLLSNLRRIESLYIDPSGNPIVTINSWVPYAIYRLGFLGLRRINDKELTTIDFDHAHYMFSFLTSSMHLLSSNHVHALLGDKKKHLTSSQLLWSSNDQRITMGDFKTEPLSRAILNCDWLSHSRGDKETDANETQTNTAQQETSPKPPSSSSSSSKKLSKITPDKLNVETFIRNTLDGAIKKHHKILYLQLVWREKFKGFLTYYLKEALCDMKNNNDDNNNNHEKNNTKGNDENENNGNNNNSNNNAKK